MSQFAHEDAPVIEPSPKVKKLKQLNSLVNKLLLDLPITQRDLLELSETESSCLRLFVLKKKMTESNDFELTQEFLNRVRRQCKSKRIEENVKFIFKKGIRFLQTVFRTQVYPGTPRLMKPQYRRLCPLRRFEYAFYGYYFGDVASEMGQPIERFFLPRQSKEFSDDKEHLLFKTISQNYINYVRRSESFVRDLATYLRHEMINEVRLGIVKKVKRMCVDWETKLTEKGEAELITWVQNNFQNNSKCKVAWSVQEAQTAIQVVLATLENFEK